MPSLGESESEKPADLPAQAPNTFYLVFHHKIVKAIGLEGAAGLGARADEVIE